MKLMLPFKVNLKVLSPHIHHTVLMCYKIAHWKARTIQFLVLFLRRRGRREH